MAPLVNILYFPGTQCEQETKAAFELAGFEARIVFIEQLLSRKVRITDCAVCHVPGGFSEMDSIDVGRISAAVARDELPKLKEQGIPTGLTCNGFQIGVEAGLFGPDIALVRNNIGTFVSRPVRHKVVAPLTGVRCIWTDGLEGQVFEFPAAHGSGKLIGNGKEIICPNTVLMYEGKSPNGGAIAGMTDDSGIFLGLMDHWERPWDNPAGQTFLANLKKNL